MPVAGTPPLPAKPTRERGALPTIDWNPLESPLLSGSEVQPAVSNQHTASRGPVEPGVEAAAFAAAAAAPLELSWGMLDEGSPTPLVLPPPPPPPPPTVVAIPGLPASPPHVGVPSFHAVHPSLGPSSTVY